MQIARKVLHLVGGGEKGAGSVPLRIYFLSALRANLMQSMCKSGIDQQNLCLVK